MQLPLFDAPVDSSAVERIAEAGRARAREWYWKNRERAIRASATWNRQNPERRRATLARSRAKNPDKGRHDRAIRRARQRAAHVEHVDSLVVLERADGACGICGEDLDPMNFDVDHIVPLARGGFHNYENCQPAHVTCNRGAGAKEAA